MGIKRDIRKLERENIIDHDTAERIAEYYRSEKRKTNIETLLFVIAAFLVGWGVVSIIAHNWDSLPKHARILIGLLALVASTAGCYYALKRKADKKPWMESMAILQSLSFVTSAAIFNQIYQVQLPADTFLWIMILSSLPFVFIMHSAALSLIVSLTTYYVYVADCTSSPLTLGITATVLVADAAYLYFYIYKRGEAFLSQLKYDLFPITLLIIFLKTLTECGLIGKDDHWRLLILFGSILFSIHTWMNESERIKCRGIIQEICFYAIFFPSIIYASFPYDVDYPDANLTSEAIPVLAVLLSVALKWKGKRKTHWQEWIAIPTCILMAQPFLTVPVFKVFAVAVIFLSIYESAKECDLLKMNCSIIALFVWVTVALNIFKTNSIHNGIILIVMGIFLIAINTFLIKKRKRHELK